MKKMILSGNFLEIYDYSRDVVYNAYSRSSDRMEHLQVNRRLDNLRSLAVNFKRLVMSNLDGSVPYLITYTFRESRDIKQGWYEIKKMHLRMRYRFGQSFRYVGVPEFGTTATKRLHFHFLYWGLPLELSNERQTRLLASMWSLGWLDLIVTDGSEKLSTYLAKYLSKAQANPLLFKQKSYVASRNILRPVIFSGVDRSDLWGTFKKGWNIDSVFNDLGTVDNWVLQFSKDFDTLWLGSCKYQFYKRL